jgi:hypothetical protein
MATLRPREAEAANTTLTEQVAALQRGWSKGSVRPPA